MRLFLHISDFGHEGWSLLPTAVLLSHCVTVWAPSFAQLKEAHREGHTLLEPKHLIELIERKRVQVMARYDWIFDKTARNSGERWRHSRFDDEFDTVLRSMAAQSSDPDPIYQPVRAMPEAQGLVWAESLSQSDIAYRRAEDRWNNGQLPQRVMERAAHAASNGDDPVISVLANAKDFQDALQESGAFAPIQPSEFPEAKTEIMAPNVPESSSGAQLSRDRVLELFQTAKSITAIKSGDDLINRIDRNDTEQFVSEFESFLKADHIPMPAQWHQQIESGMEATLSRSIMDSLRPRTKLEWATTIGGLITAVASAALNPLSVLGFGLLAIQPGKRIAERWSWIRAPYTGPTFPLFLGLGTIKPNRRELFQLLDRLSKII